MMFSHSKREVLEIFNMNEENGIAQFLLLNPPPISQLFTIFSKVVADISRNLLTQYSVKMLRTVSSLWVLHFDSVP